MSDRFSDSLLDEIRASVRITDVVGEHVTWAKGHGTATERWACCPFHSESTPSFHAVEETRSYHCFGCGVSGDHFEFLMAIKGLNFPDAVAEVAGMAGISLPERDGPAQPARSPEQPRQAAGQPTASAEMGKRVTVKAYDYTDRDGGMLYQVRRQQIKMPDGSWALNKDGKGTWKTFMQCRPSGLPDGSWLWGLSAGDYIRQPRQTDWLLWKRDRAEKWPDAEVRFFEAGPDHTIYRHPEVEIAISEGKPTLIVEGEKDADTAVTLGFCGTTNSSGSKHWTDVHAKNFAGADVVICLDNDEAGDRADKLATSLKGIARRIRVLNFADHVRGFDHKGDLTDWVERFGGDASELVEILNTLPEWKPPPPKSAFNASHIADVAVRRKLRRHSWLVQDLIELGGTTSFSGFSEAGKTFVIIELAFCIARGEKFFGHDVEQGLVIYQVGEGELGFEKRIEGYAQDRGIADRAAVPFIYLPKKINIFKDDKDTEDLIAECKAWKAYYGLPLRALFIDTWNKATRGHNEISGHDVGLINDRLERIATELECTVITVDHLSQQGTLRGHGSKTGDAANTVKVERTDKLDGNNRKIRKVVFGKNKDGEGGVTCSFVLRQVVVEYDELGRPVTTCVVDRPDGNEDDMVASGRLGLDPSILLRAIRDTADIEGEKAPAELVQVPPGRNVAKWSAVVARLRRSFSFTAPETEPEKRKAELDRCIRTGKRLQLAGFIDRDNERGLIWWTGKEDRPRRPEPKATEKPPALPPEVKEAFVGGEVPF